MQKSGYAGWLIPHSFRHTFASLLIVQIKLDPACVAAQLGHASPSITLKVYTHSSSKQTAKRAETLERRKRVK